MDNIKILDCTLREGRYVNDSNFGFENIIRITNALINSKIDFIELGYLQNIKYDRNKSLFSTLNDLELFFTNESVKYTLMIDFGEYDINLIPENKNVFLRIAFKKNQFRQALEYCRNLKLKGFNIFINPMHTNFYEKEELIDLVNLVNSVNPYAFSIVDTIGGMTREDLKDNFYLVNQLLNKDIAVCFHSHNNLQLSLSNAEFLTEICRNRTLIIDSTILGMGRGAGNLCTELILHSLNQKYEKTYNANPIIDVLEQIIKPEFKKNPWGYSIPYYLSAINKCHPNYAKYLQEHTNLSFKIMDSVLKKIPSDNKIIYNKNLIEKLLKNN